MKITYQNSYRQTRADAVADKVLPITCGEAWQAPVLVRLIPGTAAYERARAAFAMKN